MKRLVFALLLVSAAPPPPAEHRVNAAFRAAFGSPDSVLLKKQGELKEDVKYAPGDLVDTPFGPVLLSPGEVQKPSHVSLGKLAIVYLKQSAKGYEVVKKFVPATETGSFGKIVDWSVSKSFGENPVVSVNGGGNWQGYQCSTTTLVELTPQGPRQLVTVPLTYDDSGAAAGKKATQITGSIDNIQPGKSFDVGYIGFGLKDFTDRYVLKDGTYVLAGGGKSKMQTC